MSFRRAAKKDANHVEIVALFRKLGWYVLDIGQLKNCCDLIVAKNSKGIAIEIKDGNKPKSARKLSEGEAKFKNEWLGVWRLVECEEDVLKINEEIK
ncbi:MAG: hypothetical protein ACPHUL_00170 [Marinomonas gallaica]